MARRVARRLGKAWGVEVDESGGNLEGTEAVGERWW
jgi:hypothetical protein